VPVRKAVIPAAGLGTRFLPASKSIPKEMLPVVDQPGIQYVVEEIVRAGASLFNRGLTHGSTGNISVALPDGGWLMTPTGSSRGPP